MHPLSPAYFGPTGIGIRFNNGSSVVVGSIVRQIGMIRYIVTDGSQNYTVTLATTEDELAEFGPRRATLTVASPLGVVENVRFLSTDRCQTVQGNTFRWVLDAAYSFPGAGKVRTLPELGSDATTDNSAAILLMLF